MKISVIIPAFNHEKYIGVAIESVLNQSCQDFELIIINDGSTDSTAAEILKFQDPRIKYIHQNNRGAHNAINLGIEIACGEYVCILNSDDIFHSDRLEKCLTFLESRKDISAVMTEVEGIDDQGDSVVSKQTPHILAWRNWYNRALNSWNNDHFLLSALGRNILITTSNFFMRKDVFGRIGVFRGLRYAHDWDMLLRISAKLGVFLIRDVLLQYRIHETNTVHENNSENRVKLEVNWIIADNIRRSADKLDIMKIKDAMQDNHYLNYEVLATLLMVYDDASFEQYLNFNHPLSQKMMALLK